MEFNFLISIAMETPIQFPRPADVIAEQALRFRRLSAAEQAREFAEVLEAGFQQLRGHPRRDAIEARYSSRSCSGKKAQRRVFTRHASDWRLPRSMIDDFRLARR